MTGAYVGHGTQHLDYDTTQEHAAPHTTSDLAFRGILRDRATAVWSGMIKVDPGAQRTDAFQESRNLLLSDGAHADAIPGLEIEANDVRCTHAATITQLDEDPGLLPEEPRAAARDAERLLVGGFLEVIAGRLERFAVSARGGVRRARARARDRAGEHALLKLPAFAPKRIPAFFYCAAPGEPANRPCRGRLARDQGRLVLREPLRPQRHVDIRGIDRGQRRKQPPARRWRGCGRETRPGRRQLGGSRRQFTSFFQGSSGGGTIAS